MKRSALQCVVGFVGASLIVVGVIWTCRQLSSPTQLNAAQGTVAQSNAERSQTNATPLPGVKAANLAESAAKKKPISRKIRPVSGTTQLSLAPAEPRNDASSDSESLTLEVSEPQNDYPALEPSLPNAPLDSAPLDDYPGVEEQTPSFPAPTSDVETGADVEDGFPSEPFADDSYGTDDLLERPQAREGESSLKLFSQDEEDEGEEPGAPFIAPYAQDAALQSDAQDPAADLADDLPPLPAAQSAAQPVAPSLDASEEAPTLLQFTQPADPAPNAETAPTAVPSIKSNDSKRQNANSETNLTTARAAKYLADVIVARPTPGEDDQNGPQTTQIVVEKIAPEEVQAEKPTTIVIKVRNQGAKTVRNILLHDSIPMNTQFISSEPEVTPNANGDLFWPNFDLEPQREKKFEYTVSPNEEGDFGSVATVLVPINASSKTKCSKPELRVEVSAPENVELGETVTFDIVVTNVGSGAATNVALLENIPDGLYHPSGESLNNNLGVIKSGESKRLPLALKTTRQGECVNRLVVTADDCEDQEVETVVNIIAPQLELAIEGAPNVYLERPVTYKLSVKNSGDATAKNVRLVAQLPDSLAFIQANNLGAYKKEEHCVYWDLAELPARSSGDIQLTLKSVKADKTDLVFSASGPNGLEVQTSKKISIDGLAALSFTVSSNADLVEVNSELEYTVQIVNRGTKASENVTLQIAAPDAISIEATDGPTEARNYNGVIVFEKIPEIPAKSTVIYKIKALVKESGDCRVGFRLSSDDLEPLNKEINTRSYQ